VILTDAETEEAAARLVKSSLGKLWHDVPEKKGGLSHDRRLACCRTRRAQEFSKHCIPDGALILFNSYNASWASKNSPSSIPTKVGFIGMAESLSCRVIAWMGDPLS
jgi:hypothetical protein